MNLSVKTDFKKNKAGVMGLFDYLYPSVFNHKKRTCKLHSCIPEMDGIHA